jgi:hypothetical protein
MSGNQYLVEKERKGEQELVKFVSRAAFYAVCFVLLAALSEDLVIWA